VVSGRVVGHDGRPAALAHVRVFGLDRKPIETVTAAPDGAFRLPLDRVAGSVARIEIAAVDHKPESVIFCVTETPLELDVTLGTYPSAAPSAGAPAVLELVVFKEGDSWDRHAMQRQPDGTWAAEIAAPGGEIVYEVGGLAAGSRFVRPLRARRTVRRGSARGWPRRARPCTLP
jgi:hypothetical protein